MNEITVSLLYPGQRGERIPLKKIQRFSWPFEVGFAALGLLIIGLFILLVVMSFVPGGPYVFVGPSGGRFTLDPSSAPEGSIPVKDLPALAILIGVIAGTVIYGTLAAGFFILSRLFGHYRRGIVFAEAPITLMRRAGLAFVAAGLAPGLMQPLVRAAGALDENWFHAESIAQLLAGLVLLLFAQIMLLGMEVERENEDFV